MNSNSNFKDFNNLAFKSKQTSMDYDNLKNHTEAETATNKIHNKNVISDKQNSYPLIKNFKVKKASITEYTNNNSSNYNSTGNQNTITFVTPTNKNIEKDIMNSIKSNKFDKSKSKTKKDSNNFIPQIKANTLKSKTSIIQDEKEDKNLNYNPKNNQGKINLQDKIQKTNVETLIINKDIETEKDLNNNDDVNNQTQANINFYKKSIEEHRKIMDSEHEIIADSLYDLAVHFLTFKNELLNSIKPTIINNNQIHMNVNNFNQDNINNINSNNINEHLNLYNEANTNVLNDKNDNLSTNKSFFGELLDKK